MDNMSPMNLCDLLRGFDFLQPYAQQAEDLARKLEEGHLYVVLVGEYSSGKSSLLNSLLSISLPVDVLPRTASIWKIVLSRSVNEQSIAMHMVNGQQQLVGHVDEVMQHAPESIGYVEMILPSDLEDRLVLVDTPGLSNLQERHRELLRECIDEADVLIACVDANRGVTNTMLEFLQNAVAHDFPVYIAITKADTKSPNAIQEIVQYLYNQFPTLMQRVIVTSAHMHQTEELKKLLSGLSYSKEQVLSERVGYQVKRICSQALDVVNHQLQHARLDTGDVSQRLRELEEDIVASEQAIRNKKREVLAKMDEVITASTNILEQDLVGHIDQILDVFYDCPSEEERQQEISKIVRSSVNTAIQLLRGEIQQVQVEIDTFFRNIETSLVSGDINRVSQVLSSVSTLCELWIGSRTPLVDLLKLLANLLLQGLTRTYMEQKLRDHIGSNIKTYFRANLTSLIERQMDQIFEESLRDLVVRRDSLQKSVQELAEVRRRKTEEFARYIQSLRDLQRTLQKCGGN